MRQSGRQEWLRAGEGNETIKTEETQETGDTEEKQENRFLDDSGIEAGGEILLVPSRSSTSLPTAAPRGGDRTRLFPGDKGLLTTSRELGEFGTERAGSLLLVFPQDVKLTEKEKSSICYLSFPDSYSGCIGDTQFSFRFRQSVGRRASRLRDDAYNREAPPTLQREAAHFFGYVYFRQVKDVSVKRGYLQKSLVLVSRLPYPHLFHSLLQIVAPEFFEKLAPCLEAVCNGIDQWPSPAPGLTLNLPVRIPSVTDPTGGSPVRQPQNLLPAPTVLPTLHELDLYR
ncbi:Protein DENND6B [Liparis tanakae]|uniref:Protein DENND6B n=1 Tax=Liparis tanakae TaxID=230148 RepID=A0A4Z2J2V2_9TELE|nr:Protein DENND6B [Liparis tanakae]